MILKDLPPSLPIALLVVVHIGAGERGRLGRVLQLHTTWPTIDVDDKDPIIEGHVHITPPGYHMLVESDGALALSVDPPVHHCRPALDPLFESAAPVFRQHLLGIVLSGANRDGASGLQAVVRFGGRAIVQDPATAESAAMPKAARAAVPTARVLPPEALAAAIADFGRGSP